ncbi:acetyl-coenzyme A synthetase [Archaeoglobus sulfaticallidus PM70-1]|uniref:Acetate--CoA ligase n=1 Tax=Archaeoglobus sulfaticallidus PM70-1 TaxID=387631 RepID=N0BAI9_9EURY|nr:acetate--CoA ligase [Archaeoglobus sulfaticallidus]AGK60624.1 acetyl-coenzyme A synthetase [Archaeoglobus sulfaticallidus PM70-1]AGK60796.1 acetyl-coenzyme A synthetase [Archaeoglobus sulfaticallidus PM70-1]
MKETQETIASLLQEGRTFYPPEELVENSNVKRFMDEHDIPTYDELLRKAQNIEWFWSEMAREVSIEWYEPYTQVLEWNPPYAKWFINAKYNIVHDALDKQAKLRKNKLAYIWEGEPGDIRKLTYHDLYREVNRFANALKDLGIRKGDRVTIWLPMIPELPIAMLACAKIGAIHSVVFSGFSEKALLDRIQDAEAKLLITADGFYRGGKVIELKSRADQILDQTTIENVIVYDRTNINPPMKEGRDHWWQDVLGSRKCETEIMDANDTLFILYTSGTTGKPKGVIHAHGGYAVGTASTLHFIFDIKEDDIWWCSADIGWITGHSYIVYAPLILGATSVMYEGAPTHPTPARWWEIIERYGVTVFYTAPTAIRMFMRLGEKYPQNHDLSTLRLLGTVGEPINPEAWVWYYKYIGNEQCQIMDTWWQTETGMQMISPLPITPLKPGSATKPFPGIDADVFDPEGNSLHGRNAGGYLVIKKPWPAMLRGLWRAEERYINTYWSAYPNIYFTGDAARVDSEGYFWIQGRLDDVLNVSGHRIGNSEVESALVSHPAVSEAAVVGKPHEVKGEAIVAFVVLKSGIEPSEQLIDDLKQHVAKEIGKIARPDEIYFVPDLPKTRSGKIMRRVCRAVMLGKDPGDITTLANPEAVDFVRKAASGEVYFG